MAGQYKGIREAATPVTDPNDPEVITRSQMVDRYSHLRRVAEGRSRVHLRQHDGDEIFADVYPEFLSLYSRDQLLHLEKLFLMADQDRDRQLNSFELSYWMEKQENPVTQEELKQIFKVADENKDGKLSFREFLLFCQKINLTNVPAESRRLPDGLVQNTAGQSSGAHYLPGKYVEVKRPPETGVHKIHASMKPHVEEPRKANFAGTIQFFENEIARETESANKNRQAMVELSKHQNKKAKGHGHDRDPSPGVEPTRTNARLVEQPKDTEAEALHISPHISPNTYQPSLGNVKGPPHQHHKQQRCQSPAKVEPSPPAHDPQVKVIYAHKGVQAPEPEPYHAPNPPPLPLPPPPKDPRPTSKTSTEVPKSGAELVEPLVKMNRPKSASSSTQTEPLVRHAMGVQTSVSLDSLDQPSSEAPILNPTRETRNSFTATESIDFLTPVQSMAVLKNKK